MDIAFDIAGRTTVIEARDLKLVTGLEEIAQRIFFELDMQRGEYVFDLRRGFPWRELVYVKGPNFFAIEAELVRVVRGVDERIVAVDQVVFDFDPVARRLALRFRVVTVLGTLTATSAPIDLASPAFGIVLAWDGGSFRGGVFPGP